MVPYPCWGTYPFPYSHSKNQNKIFQNNNYLLKTGDPDGAFYMPAMSDVPLRSWGGRHEWFWEPGDEANILPLPVLMRMYRNSVGHNTTLIMGITPDNRGLLPDVDVKRLTEWKSEIDRVYGFPFVEKKEIGDQAVFNFDKPQTISHIVIEENIAEGERVWKYEIEILSNGKWETLLEGSCIGHKKIEWLKEPIFVSGCRFIVKKAVEKPRINRIALFAHR